MASNDGETWKWHCPRQRPDKAKPRSFLHAKEEFDWQRESWLPSAISWLYFHFTSLFFFPPPVSVSNRQLTSGLSEPHRPPVPPGERGEDGTGTLSTLKTQNQQKYQSPCFSGEAVATMSLDDSEARQARSAPSDF